MNCSTCCQETQHDLFPPTSTKNRKPLCFVWNECIYWMIPTGVNHISNVGAGVHESCCAWIITWCISLWIMESLWTVWYFGIWQIFCAFNLWLRVKWRELGSVACIQSAAEWGLASATCSVAGPIGIEAIWATVHVVASNLKLRIWDIAEITQLHCWEYTRNDPVTTAGL